MNYLSHHAVALARHGSGEEPAFYVGNVLPDLMATSGDGRLRSRMLPAEDSIEASTPLLRGIRLHIETDRAFHALPAFAEAQRQAKELLAEIDFAVRPQRVFFLAHAAVEIALDGLLLASDSQLADDFYGRFARADLLDVLARTQALFPPDAPPLLALARTIDRFVASRYLFHYADAEGQAEALQRVAERAGVAPRFGDGADAARLATFFTRLARALQPDVPRLLMTS